MRPGGGALPGAPARWWLVAALLAAAAGARAEEPTAVRRAEASARFERGVKLYDRGNYAAALAEFEAAQAAVPTYQLWLDVGLCQQKLFRYGAASRALRRYLDEGGARVGKAERAEVDRALAEIRSLAAEVEVQVEGAPARIEVDGAAEEQALSEPLLLPAGKHLIVASRGDDEPDRREVAVVSGQHLTLRLAPRPRLTTATLSVRTQPPGAELTVDGKYAGREPWSGVLEMGGHEVKAALMGFDKARAEVILTAGQNRALTLELVALPGPPPPRPWYRRWYVWTIAGVVVAGAVGGGIGGYYASLPTYDLRVSYPQR